MLDGRITLAGWAAVRADWAEPAEDPATEAVEGETDPAPVERGQHQGPDLASLT